MRNGGVPLSSLDGDVRATLEERGVAWEITEGYLELTPGGRGVEPGSFYL